MEGWGVVVAGGQWTVDGEFEFWKVVRFRF
jgi:hypothetical protein